jgi:hypothetical protein
MLYALFYMTNTQDWVGERHIKSGEVTEYTLYSREVRMGNDYKQGVNIPPAAFQNVLDRLGYLSSLSEEGALAVQIACEQMLISIILKAVVSWKAGLAGTQTATETCDGDDSEGDDENESGNSKNSPFITLEDMKVAFEESMQVLQTRVDGVGA